MGKLSPSLVGNGEGRQFRPSFAWTHARFAFDIASHNRTALLSWTEHYQRWWMFYRD
jgi:hypothetical protein